MHFLENNKPDVICMSETKLKPADKIVLDGYNIIRKERVNDIQGGGVAIWFKNCFQFYSRVYPNSCLKRACELYSSNIPCFTCHGMPIIAI